VNLVGPKEAQVQSYLPGGANVPSWEGTLTPPREYDFTVRVLQQCSLMLNYFDHLLLFGDCGSNKCDNEFIIAVVTHDDGHISHRAMWSDPHYCQMPVQHQNHSSQVTTLSFSSCFFPAKDKFPSCACLFLVFGLVDICCNSFYTVQEAADGLWLDFSPFMEQPWALALDSWCKGSSAPSLLRQVYCWPMTVIGGYWQSLRWSRDDIKVNGAMWDYCQSREYLVNHWERSLAGIIPLLQKTIPAISWAWICHES